MRIEVVGINKKTREEIEIASFAEERKAERFCNQWGWTYSDSTGDYWLGIREGDN